MKRHIAALALIAVSSQSPAQSTELCDALAVYTESVATSRDMGLNREESAEAMEYLNRKHSGGEIGSRIDTAVLGWVYDKWPNLQPDEIRYRVYAICTGERV